MTSKEQDRRQFLHLAGAGVAASLVGTKSGSAQTRRPSGRRQAIKPQFQMRQRQKDVYLSIEYLPTIGDKVARFQSFRGMASSGKLWIPRCPWGERLVNQLCVFPGRSHDDAVDVCSLFGRGLENMVWSRDKVPEPPKRGLKFGTWEWLTHGTENREQKGPRLF